MKPLLIWTTAVFLAGFAVGCGTANSTTNLQKLQITSFPPDGTAQVAYGPNGAGFTFTASGGVAPYKWSWAPFYKSRAVPPGLSLSTSGLMAGTPTVAGTFYFIVTVNDSASPPQQGGANYSITIKASSQPGATANAAAATKEVSQSPQHAHYKLVDLGTFGGPQSYVNEPNNYAPVLNDQGTVIGWADTSTPDPFPTFCFNPEQPCFVSHAFQWLKGELTDLGALPGGGSSATTWISANGLIAGFSENGETDPSLPGAPEVRAVLWKGGRIIDLKTLPDGGYESLANAVNRRGQVVGGATNTTLDNYSLYGGTETHAFLWENGVMKDLGTLGGSDSVALLINEAGQVVGESFLNDTDSPYCGSLNLPKSTGAFVWENEKMTSLGSFGGTCTFATDLNERGEVAGLSTLEGDLYQHAFLWRHGVLGELPNTLGGNNSAALAVNNNGDVAGWASLPGDQDIHATLWKGNIMTNLGTLGGDPCSLAFSINLRGQLVGISGYQQDLSGCNSGNTNRAFLWEDDSMVDLNTLIPPHSTLYLVAPETINDQGEIAGVGLDLNGNQHAFLLIPCDTNHPDVEDCDYNPVEAMAAVPLQLPPVSASGPANVKPSIRSFATNRKWRLGPGSAR